MQPNQEPINISTASLKHAINEGSQMSNSPLRGKQNADVDQATAHTRAHTHVHTPTKKN